MAFLTFVPLPGCRLPPSQPFGFQFCLNASKITFFVMALGTLPENLHEVKDQQVSRKKMLITIVLMLYQFVMIPVTMGATIVHFVGTLGDYSSFWDGYQCFGILWTLGPWWFNAMLLAMKSKMLQDALTYQGLYSNVLGDHIKVSNVLNMKEALLEGTVMDQKFMEAKSLNTGFLLTVGPYVIVWFPFLITHVIPAAVLFFPEVLLVTFLMCAVKSAMWNLGENGGLEKAEKIGGLVILPYLLLMTTLAEMLLLQAVYFYAGDGWFQSMVYVWSERQTSVYMASFHAKVMSTWYAGLDLLNEAT